MTAAPAPAVRHLVAFGTGAAVAVTDPGAASVAEALVRRTVDAVDLACSRFRDDAEVAAVAAARGEPVPVSDLLFDVLSVALEVARTTGGAADPTVGGCLSALGYDRDFALVEAAAPSRAAPRPAPGWRTVELDPAARTVRVEPGTTLDLGSCAKAFAADAAASLVAGATGAGVAVSFGGDVAVAGPPPEGGWRIGIAESSASAADAVDQVVVLDRGGLATSSPGVRAWGPGRRHHHIVDPATGESVRACWRLVSAAAPTCVEANALTTAAVVWGPGAVGALADAGLPARLVRLDGEVVTLNGWPADVLGVPVLAATAAR